MKYVFIIGSHRTGTKLLANFFNSNFENIKSVHQYPTLRYNNILSNIYLSGLMPYSVYTYIINKIWIQKLLLLKSNFYIESNGFNYLSLTIAKEKLIDSEIKILHIVRNPKTAIPSHINWIKSRTKSYIANIIIPFWNLNILYTKKYNIIKWFKKTLFEKLLLNWVWKNELIENKYSQDSNNYLLLRFEDLISKESREESLTKLLNHISLEYESKYFSYFNEKQNQSINKSFPVYKVWTNSQKESLYKHASESMKKYGYI